MRQRQERNAIAKKEEEEKLQEYLKKPESEVASSESSEEVIESGLPPIDETYVPVFVPLDVIARNEIN